MFLAALGSFVALVLALTVSAYLAGHTIGYQKARKDYRQGLRLVEGNARKKG